MQASPSSSSSTRVSLDGGSPYWMVGACHLGSTIASVEEACLGKQSCVAAVTNAGRIAKEPQCAGHFTPTLAIQLECVRDGASVQVLTVH
jgi:hypothetical protein